MRKLDNNIRPQDDFFGYVNNDWLKNNPIPPSESSWGTFYMLRDKSWKSLKVIVSELLKTSDSALSHDQKLLKTFFKTALSFSDYREEHLKTLNDEIQIINNIRDKSEIAQYLGHAHRYDFSSFWKGFVDLDDKNSQMQVLCIYQDGLNLPNRDYYLDKTAKMKKIRDAYKKHYETVTKLLPEYTPTKWDAIISIETEIAKASWTDVDLRNIQKNYTKFDLSRLQERFPTFEWELYFKGLNWKQPSDNIVICQPSFIDAVLKLISDRPLDELKDYLSWRVISNLLDWIDEKTAQVSFEFYDKTISGIKEMKPLWECAILQADNLIIGETLGREYVLRYFPESSKQAILEIVENIRESYHERIDRLIWMRDETKKVAHRKLNNIKVFVGYPSKWRDLSSLDFSNDNCIKNILSARALSSDINLNKIGKTPADEDWLMNAQTVNAYNHPNRLEIVFPAAILQPPFYDPKASYASNLGGIGAVIGHELTHGFDDQGSKFDENGNVNPWQSKDEQVAFNKLAKNIVKQANAFESVPGIYLRGKLILGEVIADIGGLELAIETLRAKTDPKKFIESFKELFINSATAECGATTEERLVELAKVDPHPPARFRVNCTVNHIDSFYETYNVMPGDKLYLPPEDRAHIW
jgi:predicted metalloendopeptidase